MPATTLDSTKASSKGMLVHSNSRVGEISRISDLDLTNSSSNRKDSPVGQLGNHSILNTAGQV